MLGAQGTNVFMGQINESEEGALKTAWGQTPQIDPVLVYSFFITFRLGDLMAQCAPAWPGSLLPS